MYRREVLEGLGAAAATAVAPVDAGAAAADDAYQEVRSQAEEAVELFAALGERHREMVGTHAYPELYAGSVNKPFDTFSRSVPVLDSEAWHDYREEDVPAEEAFRELAGYDRLAVERNGYPPDRYAYMFDQVSLPLVVEDEAAVRITHLYDEQELSKKDQERMREALQGAATDLGDISMEVTFRERSAGDPEDQMQRYVRDWDHEGVDGYEGSTVDIFLREDDVDDLRGWSYYNYPLAWVELPDGGPDAADWFHDVLVHEWGHNALNVGHPLAGAVMASGGGDGSRFGAWTRAWYDNLAETTFDVAYEERDDGVGFRVDVVPGQRSQAREEALFTANLEPYFTHSGLDMEEWGMQLETEARAGAMDVDRARYTRVFEDGRGVMMELAVGYHVEGAALETFDVPPLRQPAVAPAAAAEGGVAPAYRAGDGRL